MAARPSSVATRAWRVHGLPLRVLTTACAGNCAEPQPSGGPGHEQLTDGFDYRPLIQRPSCSCALLRLSVVMVFRRRRRCGKRSRDLFATAVLRASVSARFTRCAANPSMIFLPSRREYCQSTGSRRKILLLQPPQGPIEKPGCVALITHIVSLLRYGMAGMRQIQEIKNAPTNSFTPPWRSASRATSISRTASPYSPDDYRSSFRLRTHILLDMAILCKSNRGSPSGALVQKALIIQRMVVLLRPAWRSPPDWVCCNILR